MVQLPPPKSPKNLFHVALTDKKHNIVELNSCVVLFVFNIIYVIKGGEKCLKNILTGHMKLTIFRILYRKKNR